MIRERHVLRMKVPYPSISSDLAIQAHMYICKNASHPKYGFFKCQTLKPYMLTNTIMKHYCDEVPDQQRNPFQKTTRIDCDKLFTSCTVEYDDRLLTTLREDICPELFTEIIGELEAEGYIDVAMNENDLVELNPLITPINNIRD